MRRKIKAQREKTIYKQAERKRALLDGIVIILLSGVGISIVGGIIYFILSVKGLT